MTDDDDNDYDLVGQTQHTGDYKTDSRRYTNDDDDDVIQVLCICL